MPCPKRASSGGNLGLRETMFYFSSCSLDHEALSVDACMTLSHLSHKSRVKSSKVCGHTGRLASSNTLLKLFLHAVHAVIHAVRFHASPRLVITLCVLGRHCAARRTSSRRCSRSRGIPTSATTTTSTTARRMCARTPSPAHLIIQCLRVTVVPRKASCYRPALDAVNSKESRCCSMFAQPEHLLSDCTVG